MASQTITIPGLDDMGVWAANQGPLGYDELVGAYKIDNDNLFEGSDPVFLVQLEIDSNNGIRMSLRRPTSGTGNPTVNEADQPVQFSIGARGVRQNPLAFDFLNVRDARQFFVAGPYYTGNARLATGFDPYSWKLVGSSHSELIKWKNGLGVDSPIKITISDENPYTSVQSNASEVEVYTSLKVYKFDDPSQNPALDPRELSTEIILNGLKPLEGVLQESVVVESILGQVVDTAEFTIRDKGRWVLDENNMLIQKGSPLQTLSDVIIVREYRVVDPTIIGPAVPTVGGAGDIADDIDPIKVERIFGGIIAYIDGSTEGVERLWHVSCQDYTVLLDRSLVLNDYNADYEYMTQELDDDGNEVDVTLVGDRALLASIFERSVLGSGGGTSSSEINARTFVEQGLTSLSQQVFRYSTLREVVSQLAQYVGFDFYVDYHKNLHFYYREDQMSQLSLTDPRYQLTSTNTVVPTGSSRVSDIMYRGISWKRDGTRLVNAFALFGDRLVSDSQVFVLPSTGGSEYDLSFDTIRINFPLLAEPGTETNAIRVGINANADRALTENEHEGPEEGGILINVGGDFVVDGVVVGDIIVNTTDGSWGEVTNVTRTRVSAGMREGVTNVWNVGDRAAVPTWRELGVSNDVLLGRTSTDVFHDTVGKTLTFNTVTPPVSDYSIRLRFAHSFVGGQVSVDELSREKYGRIFARRVVASDVNSALGIVQKLEHLKEQYSYALEVVSVTLDDELHREDDAVQFASYIGDLTRDAPNFRRFKAGDWVQFTNNVLGVQKELLIHRVTTRVLSGRMLEYEVEMRDWETDII